MKLEDMSIFIRHATKVQYVCILYHILPIYKSIIAKQHKTVNGYTNTVGSSG